MIGVVEQFGWQLEPLEAEHGCVSLLAKPDTASQWFGTLQMSALERSVGVVWRHGHFGNDGSGQVGWNHWTQCEQ